MDITAIYLPVEKERATAGKLGTITVKEQAYEVAKKNSPELVHVRLFAVTSDIKNGDKVIHIETFKKSHCGKTGIWINPDGNWVTILGELSERAIWVKEGDKIEVKDAYYWHAGVEYEEIGEYNVGKKMENLAIKCPTCKYYH